MTQRDIPFVVVSTAVLCVGALIASAWYLRAPGLACDHLTPLTVVATISAFLISICFRLMARHKDRRLRLILAVCVVVAGIALVLDFRYVRHYRDVCDSLRQGIPLLK